MVDYASGSIGGSIGAAPSLDPWSENNSLHRSLGGMYQFGGLNRNMASYNTMFGADAQMYYSGMSDTPASQSYKSPDYALKDFGMSQYIKHKILGAPVAIGQEHASRDIAEKEQSSLFWAGLGFDTASFATSVGSGVAGLYAGGLTAGVATGGIGLVAGMAIDTARETYMDNYRRTSDVAGITNRFVNRDGTRGLDKKDNIEITKFLGEMAADDPLLDIKDTENIMKMASASGMMNAESTASGVKKKLKELTKTLKAVADITGSSDMRGLMGQLKKFNMLGVESIDAKKMIANMAYSADIAGFSRNTVENYNNSAMMASRSTGTSIGTVVGNTSRNVIDAGLIRQSSGMILSRADDNTMLSTMQEMDQRATSFMKNRGVDSSQRIVSAEAESKQTGRSIADILGSYKNMSASELSKRVASIGDNISNSDEREMYRRRMSSVSERTFYVSDKANLAKLDAGSSKDIMLKDMSSYMKRTNKSAGAAIANFMDINTMGRNEHAGWVSALNIESSPTEKRKRDIARSNADESKRNRGRQQVLARASETGKVGYQVMKGLGHIWDFGRNISGGFSSSANTNNMALSKYSGGIYGETSGGRRYRESGIEAVDQDMLSLLGIDNRFKGKQQESGGVLKMSDISMDRSNDFWRDFSVVASDRKKQIETMKDSVYKEISDNTIKNTYHGIHGEEKERIDLAYGNIELNGASNTEKLGMATAVIQGRVDDYVSHQKKEYLQRGLNPSLIYSDENIATAKKLGSDIQSGRVSPKAYAYGARKGQVIGYDSDQSKLSDDFRMKLLEISDKAGIMYDTSGQTEKAVKAFMNAGGKMSDISADELAELNLDSDIADTILRMDMDHKNTGIKRSKDKFLGIESYGDESEEWKKENDAFHKKINSLNLTNDQMVKTGELFRSMGEDSDHGEVFSPMEAKEKLSDIGIGSSDASSLIASFSRMKEEAVNDLIGSDTTHLGASIAESFNQNNENMIVAKERKKKTAAEVLASRSNMSSEDAREYIGIYATSNKDNIRERATKFLSDHNVNMSFDKANEVMNSGVVDDKQEQKDIQDIAFYTKKSSETLENVAKHLKGE